MATKFPKFSQALAQDPATRRIWYGIATAHDLEAHDGMTEENLYQKNFRVTFRSLSRYFLMDFRKLISCCLARKF
jgi:photosystem I P700 chlorophyll a apoprotein A2